MIVISGLYSLIDNNDSSINMTTFWASTLSSAFVDIISLVISTILITAIINRQKSFVKKKDLYLVVKEDHIRLTKLMKIRYKNIMFAEEGGKITTEFDQMGIDYKTVDMYLKQNEGENISTEFEQLDFDYKNIDIYLKQIEDENLQSHYVERIVNKKSISEHNIKHIHSTKEKVPRLFLFVEYIETVENNISSYIRDYGVFFNEEYLVLLVNIKKSLNNNLFELYEGYYGLGIAPIKISNFDRFISKNKDYINKVLEFEEYFNDLDKQVNTESNMWKGITIGAILIFLSFIIIKLAGFLVSI